ncbi:hypothetical protein KDU71_19470 [Carboxylicivirga sediminis]|uniref:HEAT repeat domain-containing protein n=1 Tax=Carboxylicivirga sediminis TaxID=2006564 RepID=A0A941FA08_9BACT|nr:hypothetical protein [Carboxylicivirga sediminis]MBR8537760.1 hypothetical protein [Carboxylicivirga sediminis]
MRTNITHRFTKIGHFIVLIAMMLAVTSSAMAGEMSDDGDKIRKKIIEERDKLREEIYQQRDELREEMMELKKHYTADKYDISAVASDFPFDLKYKGIIDLSDDSKMITGISANGFVEINKTAFGNNRRLFIHADDKGTITYEYYVGKTETAFNPEGKKWLGEILPDIVKRSDLGVESRVRHLYRTKGIRDVLDALEELPSGTTYSYTSEWNVFTIKSSSYKTGSSASKNTFLKTLVFDNELKSQDIIPVLSEIKEVRSNSTKGTLIRYILENYKLSTEQLAVLLEATATHDYNTERGSTLRMFNKFYVNDFAIRKGYFDIIDDMEINSEKGNVLKHLVRVTKLSNDSWISMLQTIDDFSSEREKGALLLYLIKYMPQDEEVMEVFRDVLDNMSDSYYILKGEITTALLDAALDSGAQKSDKASLINYLKTARGISSNSQKGLILRKANRLFINDEEVVDVYFEALNGLDSEMEMYNVMLDLLAKNKLEEPAMYRLLRTLDRLVDDFQHGAGAVMREVVAQFPLSTNNYNQFFRLINRMDQNSTIEELLRYVIDSPVMNDEIAAKVIECTQQIDVDVERAAVLVRLSPYISNSSSSTAYIFKSMTKDLESEYEKNRVLKTLN